MAVNTEKIYPIGRKSYCASAYINPDGSLTLEHNTHSIYYDFSDLKNLYSATLHFKFEKISCVQGEYGLPYQTTEVTSNIGYSETTTGYFTIGIEETRVLNQDDLDEIKITGKANLFFKTTATPRGSLTVHEKTWLGDVWVNISNDETNYMEISYKEPEINSFEVIGSNIDNIITCNFELADSDSWEVQAILNGNVVCTKTGTTQRSVTFNVGELRQKGNYTFKLIAKSGTTTESTKEVTLTRIEPSIISLEPDNVTASKDEIISVSWVSQNQQKFDLIVDGNKYAGTTAKSVNVPIGVINSLGNKQISLTVYYTSQWGEVRQATKTVQFTAVGKPRNPILDGYSYYSNANPTFTWTNKDEVVQFRVQVLKENNTVDDSGDVISTDTSYTCQTALDNETEYKVQVKVKTQYGYWSEWSSKTFTTNFVVANKPSIDVFVSDNSVIINSFTVYSEAFDHCDIYRRTEYSEWVRIAYNLDNNVSFKDEYVGKEKYYYKVSSVSTTGGIRDSDTATANINIQNFNFSNIEDINNGVEFICDPYVEFTDVFEQATNEYIGVYAPVIDDGEHNYRTASMSFTCEKETYDKFKSIIRNSKVMIYRDCRGEKVFCKVVDNIKRPKFEEGWITISFNIVEVPFLEKDMYKGDGNQYLVFWDGKYKWDGSITFDGEGTLVNE